MEKTTSKAKESKDFTCPECNSPLRFTVDNRHIECPKCGRMFL